MTIEELKIVAKMYDDIEWNKPRLPKGRLAILVSYIPALLDELIRLNCIVSKSASNSLMEQHCFECYRDLKDRKCRLKETLDEF